MDDQLQIDFFSKPGQQEDPHDGLARMIAGKEPLVFLHGQNQHICCARSHSSKETGNGLWVKRKRAEDMLRAEKYYIHGYYLEGKDKAKVFRRSDLKGGKRNDGTEI